VLEASKKKKKTMRKRQIYLSSLSYLTLPYLTYFISPRLNPYLSPPCPFWQEYTTKPHHPSIPLTPQKKFQGKMKKKKRLPQKTNNILAERENISLHCLTPCPH
jgi:hypothetical protein